MQGRRTWPCLHGVTFLFEPRQLELKRAGFGGVSVASFLYLMRGAFGVPFVL